jgi:hypothetical protein
LGIAMNQLMGLLSPGLLLRSLFSGVFFVIAFLIARDGSDALQATGTIDHLATVLAAALVAGVITYTFHRSLIYALLEWLLNKGCMETARKHAPLISRETVLVLLAQWDRGLKPNEILLERAKHFSTWADYAHLQYTSALCIGFGSLCGRIVGGGKVETYWPLVFLAAAFVVAAAVSDWRLHAVREQYAETAERVNKP